MGILVKKPILVAQCGHALNAEAFWTNDNTGQLAPDLWYENFPTTGRMLLTNQVLYLSCRQCQNGLDEIMRDFRQTADA
jgi:hypothetical protein